MSKRSSINTLTIKEIKSSNYKIEPIKMANDEFIKNLKSPLPDKYGFFILLVGKPNSGKSTLWINLINKKAKNTYYKKFDKVFIFSNSLHTITTKIKLDKERMFNGIDNLEEVLEEIKDTEGQNLIILDDVVTDIKGSDDYILKMIYNRRHMGGGVSLIITSQVYNKVPLAVRKCATELVIFNTTNKKEIESIFNDFINIDYDTYQKLIKYCFKSNIHDFMIVKTSDNTFYHNFNLLQFE
jgi:GTPase SAR1 family protein